MGGIEPIDVHRCLCPVDARARPFTQFTPMLRVSRPLSTRRAFAGALIVSCAVSCGPVAPQEPGTLRIEAPEHFVHGYPATLPDGRLQVVIEVPAGTLAKWEVDAEGGALEWEFVDGAPRVVRFLGYPGNYGMVPRTLHSLESGGDGDPLDVIVLGASVERGSILAATPIGVLEMVDRGERDEKIVAVTEGSPFEAIRSMEELDAQMPGASAILSTWFSSYKGPGLTEIGGISGPGRAQELIDEAIKDYAATRAPGAETDPPRAPGGR